MKISTLKYDKEEISKMRMEVRLSATLYINENEKRDTSSAQKNDKLSPELKATVQFQENMCEL